MAQEQMDIVVKLIDEASAKLSEIKRGVDGVGTKAEDTNKRFSNFASSASIGLAALGTAAVGATTLIVSSILKQAGAFEQSTIAFSTMLGSAEAGQKVLTELSQFASKTPFTLPGVESAAKQLLAMGISTESLLPTLKSLGDVSAGLSVPIEQIGLAYGQVRAANQLMGSELRQFVQAGVPLLSVLAEMFNTNEASIKKMVEQGEIGFDAVEEAFQRMTGTGGQFENLMDRQSKSLLGLLSNLSDQFTLLARAVGAPLIEKIKPALESLIETISNLSATITESGITEFFEKNQTLVLVIAGAIGSILVGSMVALIAAFVSFAAPAIAATAAIAAIGGALAFFIKNIIDGIPAVIELAQTIKGRFVEVITFVGEKLTQFGQFIVSIFDGIKNAVTAVVDGIANVLKFWVSFVTGLILLAFEAMGIDIVQIWTDLTTAISGFLDFLNEKFTGFVMVIQELWFFLWGFVANFAMTKWSELKKNFLDATTSITNTFSPWVDSLKKLWESMWSAMIGAATSAWESVKFIVKSGINWIIEKMNNLIQTINDIVSKGAGLFKISPIQISTIPLLAKGGNIMRSGSAIVGEAGPELVSLPQGAQVTPLNESGGITIVINNPIVMNDDDIIERIGEPIIRVLKQHTAIA